MILDQDIAPEFPEPYAASGSAPTPQGDYWDDFFCRMQKALSAPTYEYDGPFPVGGIDGSFTFGNKGDTPVEVLLAFVSFNGAGFYAVSESVPVTPTNTATYNPDPYPTRRGWVIVSDAAKTIHLSDALWLPLEALGQLGIVVSASGKAVWGHFYTRRRVLPGGQAAQALR